MKVGVFVGYGRPQDGGAHAVVRAVVSALASQETSHNLVVVHSGFEGLSTVAGGMEVQYLPTARERDDARPGRRGIARRVVSRLQRSMPRISRPAAAAPPPPIEGFDLVWFLTPIVRATALPYVLTVWDLAHRLHPFFPELDIAAWRWDQREEHYRQWIPRAAFVVIGATAGKQDIERVYGASPDRIRVLPLVAPDRRDHSDDVSVPLPEALTQPYVFYPAQFWPHKNHVALLHALRILRNERGIVIKLALAGSNKGNAEHVRNVARQLGVEQDVVFLGFVSDDELVTLYRRSLALVFPSYFGPDNLPPLEAFQLGVPVIAARIPGADEQMGDAAILVDASKPEEFADAIERLHRDPTLRQALVERGEARAAQWTAAHYARAMIGVIDEFAPVRSCWPQAPTA